MKNLFERYLMIEEENIYTPATPEEVEERKGTFPLKYIEDLIQSGKATRNADGTVDVDGDVKLNGMGLTRIPVKFGRVSGSFDCMNNKLTSLEGCPREVGGKFWCSSNNLESLEGSPRKVGGNFGCSKNNLTSLEGCPKEVGGDFYCYNNNLSSLEGCPEYVGGSFWCDNNNLMSLEGCPKEVGGNFGCTNQQNGHEFTEEEVEAVCNVEGAIITNSSSIPPPRL